MRTSLALPAIGLILTHLSGTTIANVEKRQQTVQRCTRNAWYKGFWDNTEIAHDVTTYCRSLLGWTPVTSCTAYETTYTTEMPNASTTYTVTSTTDVPASTVTATTTVVVFVATTVGSTSTTRPARYIRQATDEVAKRQASTTTNTSPSTSINYIASFSSACTCNRGLRSETRYSICTETSTVYDTVVDQTITTVYQTVTTPGVTTVFTTVNETSTITVSNGTSSTSTTSWEVVISSTTTSATTTSSTSTTTSSTTTSKTTTWDDVSTTTSSSTSTSTIQPSGCPNINGTRLSSNTMACTYYERVCYRTYATKDFYNTELNYDTPEECAAVCDAQNRGMSTPCLGIVWNTTTTRGANCRLLKSVNWPEDDISSIAILLHRESNCGTSSSTTTTTSSTSTTSTTSTPSDSNTVSPTLISGTTSSTSTGTSTGTVSTIVMSGNGTSTSTETSSSTTSSTSTSSSTTSSAITTSTATYNTTTTSLNGTTSTSCIATTIYATQYETVTAPPGQWNSSWGNTRMRDPDMNKTHTTTETEYVTITPNGTYITVTRDQGRGNNTVTKYKTVTVSDTGATTVVTTKTESVVTTQTFVAYTTVSTCPVSATSTPSSSGANSPTVTDPIVSPTLISTTTTTTTTTTTRRRGKGQGW